MDLLDVMIEELKEEEVIEEKVIEREEMLRKSIIPTKSNRRMFETDMETQFADDVTMTSENFMSDFYAIPREMAYYLLKARLGITERAVFDYIMMRTLAFWKKGTFELCKRIKHKHIMKATGLDQSTTSRCLRKLRKKNIVYIYSDSNIGFNPVWKNWKTNTAALENGLKYREKHEETSI